MENHILFGQHRSRNLARGAARGLQSAREAARLSEDSSERLRVAGKARQSVQVPEQARARRALRLPVIVILRSSPKRSSVSSLNSRFRSKGSNSLPRYTA